MEKKKSSLITIEELATFCKRKGFVYPSGEIYGGLAGFWDFGHLGVELKNNIKKEWWKFHVHSREEVVGIDGAIITNPKVWEASGHVKSFVEIVIKDKKTKELFKVDVHESGKYKDTDKYSIEGTFNPMFTTTVGPNLSSQTQAFLRPETAQLIFTNFKAVQDNARLKLPFGIAQIGKAFRNEVSPREFIFRNREFEQMELEYFTAPKQKCPYIDEIKGIEIQLLTETMQKKNQKPKKMEIFDAHKKGLIKSDWHAYFLALELSLFLSLGANPEKFRARQHKKEELSHYSSDTWDLEYEFPMGWRELQGFADRSNYDLKQHEQYSKKSMEIHDENHGKLIPQVICEPSLGVERAFLVFMLDAYERDKERDNIVLHIDPKLAPYKAAIFPLVSKGPILETSKEIYRDLLEEFNVLFDKSGSIGRRYARNDEIGTPYCITADEQTLEDKTITIRERDSTKQIRVPIIKLHDTLRNLINDKVTFQDAGEKLE